MDDIQLVFDNLVDLTEPICQSIDSAKADMTIFGSSGIEAFVTENNPSLDTKLQTSIASFAITYLFYSILLYNSNVL